jgi:hypothetical protein
MPEAKSVSPRRKKENQFLIRGSNRLSCEMNDDRFFPRALSGFVNLNDQFIYKMPLALFGCGPS